MTDRVLKLSDLATVEAVTQHARRVVAHGKKFWGEPRLRRMKAGRIGELPDDFCVAEFPREERDYWTYATVGMSQPEDEAGLEIFLLSPVQSPLHVETLSAIAHYHRTGKPLDLGHTVNFGRPWLPGSRCEYGLLSLPYLEGPKLEYARIAGRDVRFLWLIPITKSEVELKKKHGLEALEARFDEAQFNYLDPNRPAVA